MQPETADETALAPDRAGAAAFRAPPGRPTPGLDGVARAVAELEELQVGGLWGSSQALVLAHLIEGSSEPWTIVVSTEAEAESFAADLETFGAPAVVFAARESSSRGGGVDLDSVQRRLAVARRLAGPPAERPRVLVASLLSLLQPVPDPGEMERSLVELAVGQALEVEHLLRRLVDSGFTRQPLVEKPGEVSLRGDIFDVWPFAAELPVRIEMFDDEIESLRTFDAVEQRSVQAAQRMGLNLATDSGGVEDGHGVRPAVLLPGDSRMVEVEPLRIEDQAGGLSIRSASHQRELGHLRKVVAGHRRLKLQSLPSSGRRGLNLDTRSVQALAGGIKRAPELLAEVTADGSRVRVLCHNEAEARRFAKVIDETGGVTGLEVAVGGVAKGFRMPELGLTVVNHRELVGVLGVRAARAARPAHKTRALQSFFELKPGDFVVHAVHGLALYKGLERMTRVGGEEEHLHLLFADDVSLFVPATRIDLVQRYIGSGGAAPQRDKIGGQSFRRRREKVERALFDLAADLLEVQAKRELNERPAWEPDDELVRELIAAFPYEDTPDQARSDTEIAGDLTGSRPTDRLLCGDVGFGKTELAVRASFRVASAGGQVAILVPTTVLAHQHTITFQERLADFPVEVATLSRTVSGKAEKEVVARVARGEIDILIGTHRILSKDVSFKRLGLVIIDEEQRFGVAHKEHFKGLRATIDLLTLSATPIPRTLHMSLSGVRDISSLSDPPPGRQEIETRLADGEDDALIREALLREKNRGGQVFFLHNKVSSIQGMARRLANLVPECSFAVGHGQMPAKELERLMDTFTRGEVDVLVATTIVENGLDIPAAGTIFIDDADHFGLSELHQLRGRVGRGEHKAWCYLLVARHKPIRQVARERLKALEEMNHLGAGFAISMKDLELRGAGNILGPQQSGHIGAVGYDMYCRLLKQTIERMRAGLGPDRAATEHELSAGVELELGLDALLPEAWIPSQDTRLEILRKLDEIDGDAAAGEAEAALRDRFGRLPPEAELLLRSFRLRARAQPLGITSLRWRGDSYLIEFADRVVLEETLRRAGRIELRPLKTGQALLMVPLKARKPLAGLAWLEELLKTP